MKPITCPVGIASKARRANRPASSTPEDRSTELWQDVYTDLSGKIRTPSVTGALYFAVFVDGYTGSKHVEFLKSKKHTSSATNASSLTISYVGRHPKKLRSDQGTEILNKEFTAYLESNHTHHVV
jgi:hypothetical protein